MQMFGNTRKVSELESLLSREGVRMSQEDRDRLNKYRVNMDFYEGYHWEGIAVDDRPQITENYIGSFVDNFVTTELGKGFTINMKPSIEKIDTENDPLDFLNNVWEYNDKLERLIEMGQSKSTFGDVWIQVHFESPDEGSDMGVLNDDALFDPFGEYPNGKITISVNHPGIFFPTYRDKHNNKDLIKLEIMYPIKKEEKKAFSNKTSTKTVLYKQVWTRDKVEVFEGTELKHSISNKYGLIPFVKIKNYPKIGSNYGASDIDDLIPLNVELNSKKSNVSEIVDYHASPVTLVFGARVRELERGAGKMWGGLPSTARVENLKSEGDVGSATEHIKGIKKAMHEIGKMPEGVLGGNLSISNTSGVALEILLKPLLDYVAVKRTLSKEGIEQVNKIILYIAIKEGIIEIPEGVEKRDFYQNEVVFGEVLPKDILLMLQELEQEMRLGFESRKGAMERLGKPNIQEKISEVDRDMEENPSIYGREDIKKRVELAKALSDNGVEEKTRRKQMDSRRPVGENKFGEDKQLNSGHFNGPEPKKF